MSVGNTAVDKFKFITTYKLVVTLKFNPQFDYHTPLRRLVLTFDETPLIKTDCLAAMHRSTLPAESPLFNMGASFTGDCHQLPPVGRRG